MRVDVKVGGDGVLCWNRAAIDAYASSVDEREARLARDNADLVVVPGVAKCYGCEELEYDLGTRCTLQLTRSRFGIEGEIQPRAEDAAGSVLDIDGLLTRISTETAAEIRAASPVSASVGAPAAPAPASSAPVRHLAPPPTPEPKRSGIRGLFGR